MPTSTILALTVVDGHTREVLEPVTGVVLRSQQRNIKLRFLHVNMETYLFDMISVAKISKISSRHVPHSL